MKYQIFSDGACDLSIEVQKEYSIEVIPFYVSLDSENYYKEREELSVEDFYRDFSEGPLPKTSLPSIQDYINAFTPFLEAGEDILCFTISNTLSGSYQSAMNAKDIISESFPDRKVLIIDSFLCTVGQGLLVMESAKMKTAGYCLEVNYEKSELLKTTGRIYFYVGDLLHLEKGGRIGQISSLLGSILKIIPVIRLKDGSISVGGASRSQKKAIEKIAAMTRNHFLDIKKQFKDYSFIVGSTMKSVEAADLFKGLTEFIDESLFLPTSTIGATTATHTGPETVGLGFIQRYDTI